MVTHGFYIHFTVLTRRDAIGLIAATGIAGTAQAKRAGMIVPFEIPFDQGMTDDLRRRLAAVRWNDAVTADWSQGTQSSFLSALIAHWQDHYDWRERSAVLNQLPHRRATIDGYGVHFLHSRGHGPRPYHCC